MNATVAVRLSVAILYREALDMGLPQSDAREWAEREYAARRAPYRVEVASPAGASATHSFATFPEALAAYSDLRRRYRGTSRVVSLYNVDACDAENPSGLSDVEWEEVEAVEGVA